VPEPSWHFHDSQAAQDGMSQQASLRGVELGQQDQEPAGRRGQMPGQRADLRFQVRERPAAA